MFDELVEIICNYVDVQPADVHEESRFMEDLGFMSFDFMSMLGEIEDTFDVEVSPAELIPANFNSAKSLWEMICRLKED